MDFWGILEYTVAVTVIGLFIWLGKLIFHDKLDARWHYFIWLVLLVRLLVPFRFGLISTPISVFQDIPLETWIEMGRILAEKGGYGEVIIGLGKLWLLGAVLLGGFYLAMWAVLRIRIARAPKADEDVRRYVDRIAGKYGLKSCSDIRILNIQAHESQTQGEKQVKPLFLLLAADYFVHWIWQFENGVEMLLTTVIYIYAIYVLFGEVAERIRAQQPECAGRLDVIRAGMVLLPMFAFLSSAYGNNVLNIAVIFAVVALAASCTVVICGIVPERPGG